MGMIGAFDVRFSGNGQTELRLQSPRHTGICTKPKASGAANLFLLDMQEKASSPPAWRLPGVTMSS